LTAKYHVGSQKLVEALKDLFGVELSVGAVQAICEEVSEVVAPAVSEVQAEVEKSPAVNADETGWRQKGQMHWLWTSATPDAAFFVLAPDRGHAALEELFLQAQGGILMSDRWLA
jgi:transposase